MTAADVSLVAAGGQIPMAWVADGLFDVDQFDAGKCVESKTLVGAAVQRLPVGLRRGIEWSLSGAPDRHFWA